LNEQFENKKQLRWIKEETLSQKKMINGSSETGEGKRKST